jgi:RNA polymerase-binding transcription factor DksA
LRESREVEMFMPARTTTSAKTRLCSLCGRPIAAARLEALPGVTTCIECAKKHPRKVDVSGIELSQASPINRNGFAPYD